MKESLYFKITGIIFLIIFILHLIRLIYKWDVQFNNIIIPLWVSWMFLVISGYLVFSAFKLSKK